MADAKRYLIVSLEGEGYAVPVAGVAEIASAHGLEPDPKLATFFEGKIELRGKRLPVLNLKRLFKIEGKPGKVLLVISSGRGEIGILVDAVTEILDAESDPIPMPQGVVNPSLGYYRGILRHRGELILVLNTDVLI